MTQPDTNKKFNPKLLFIIIAVIVIIALISKSGGSKEDYSDACKCATVLSVDELPQESESAKMKDGYYTCKSKYGGWSIANEKCIENK